MDRYQFEDLISDYIENTLSLSQRKAFDAYLVSHPEAQDEVNSLRDTMMTMKNMNDVKTSHAFMSKLKSRIAQENIQSVLTQKQEKTFFGFTPLYASIFSLMVIALVFTGIQFVPNSPNVNPTRNMQSHMAEQTTNSPTKYQAPIERTSSDLLAEAPEDSLIDDSQPLRNNTNFNDGIQLVKNPR